MAGYGNRDAAIAAYYESLYKAGAVEEGYQFYGCAYETDGEIHLYVTEQEQKIFAFTLACKSKQQHCTPVQLQTSWLKVPKGNRQLYKRELQIDFAKQLAEQYSQDFFHVIKSLPQTKNNFPAESYIRHQNETLDCAGELSDLELFENTVAMMTQRKLVSTETAEKCLQHSRQMRQQMSQYEVLPTGEKHQYAGFCILEPDGSKKYRQYARYATAQKAYEEAQLQQKKLSPLFMKTYSFDPVDFRQVQEHKDAFGRLLREKLDSRYMKEISEILESAVYTFSQEEWAELQHACAGFNQWESEAFLLFLAESGYRHP